MGDMKSLGWVVLKTPTFILDKKQNKTPNFDLIQDVQKIEKEDITKWSDIQMSSTRNLQFPDTLNMSPQYLDYLFNNLTKYKLKGSRYMKYQEIYASDSGCEIPKDYPGLSGHLEKCLELCSDYIKSTTSLKCKFKLQGKNILANHNGVFRQYIHTDYGYEEKKR